MSTPAKKRLVKDYRKIQKDAPIGISAQPDCDNIMKWRATIHGPECTPWEGGIFKLIIEFTEDYPNVPPRAKFTSKIFHPNVYTDGGICLDILQNQWSSLYDPCAILTSIQSLLSDPNPTSPANCEAAALLTKNEKEYNRRIKAAVEKSWVDSDDDTESNEDLKEEEEEIKATMNVIKEKRKWDVREGKESKEEESLVMTNEKKHGNNRVKEMKKLKMTTSTSMEKMKSKF